MSEHGLRHLAVVAGTAPAAADDVAAVAAVVAASCGKAAALAGEAFALVPGLLAFSWLTPGIDRLLARADGRVADHAHAAGARTLAAAATALGASLRLCGRRSGEALGRRPSAPEGRTLLWFQEYSGRDEIVRAAGRFLRANPGKTLADGELDAWLDTAGVPDPDLLVYAGGVLEPQDVLLWQGSYAEIWHTPEPWQSFSGAELHRAVSDYHARQRRFGL